LFRIKNLASDGKLLCFVFLPENWSAVVAAREEVMGVVPAFVVKVVGGAHL
jgi:hypothetical protein